MNISRRTRRSSCSVAGLVTRMIVSRATFRGTIPRLSRSSRVLERAGEEALVADKEF